MKKHGDFLSYKVVVRDKDGKVLFSEAAPSKSFVEQWNKLVNIAARNNTQTVRDTGGVNRSVAVSGTTFTATAPIGQINYGIRIGKGSTPVAITDYALETPLAHGTGLDQVQHQVMQFTAPVVAGSTCSFSTQRILVNNSGANITGVQEVGCYVRMGGASYYGMGFRDVLGGPCDIPDGGSITVEYTIGVTV